MEIYADVPVLIDFPQSRAMPIERDLSVPMTGSCIAQSNDDFHDHHIAQSLAVNKDVMNRDRLTLIRISKKRRASQLAMCDLVAARKWDCSA
jgi:hypothetical protein